MGGMVAVLVTQLAGVGLFLVLSVVLGLLVRGTLEGRSAERLSRVSHLAFWLGLVLPWMLGLFVPGPSALDRLVGLSPLPLHLWLRVTFGGLLLVPGAAVMQLAISRLGRSGHGAPALKLTSAVVSKGLYAAVRNPMSLGFYVALLGAAVLSGSSYVLLYTCLGVIPVHLLNLWFFEERELTLRYGESYERYRAATPFLIPRLGPPHERWSR